ncbi:MAG: sigma factor, partial [Bacteroidaceae bacterium]
MSSTSDNDTIQSLLHRFLGGCDKSFSDIYTLLVDDLYVYGVSFDISEEVVEDIIQDIFCYLYLNKKKFSQVTNLKSYLFRSLKNRILDTYKKKPCIPFEDALGNELTFSLKVSVEDNYIQDESKQLLEKQINKMLECLN